MGRLACSMALAVVALAEPGGAVTAADLPPVECVAALRAARQVLHREGAAAALSLLERAREVCGNHLDLLLERLELHREIADEAGAKVDLDALRSALADREVPLTAAALVRALVDGTATRAELEAIASRIEAELVASPTDTLLLRALAVARSRLGDDPAARAALARLLELDPSAEVRWAAVRMDVALGRWERAIPELEALSGTAGRGSVAARLHLVRAYGAVGRFEDAVRAGRQLERMAGAGSEAIRALVAGALLDAAWSLHDRGQQGRARDLFREALALDPELEEARRALELADASPAERLERARAAREAGPAAGDPLELLDEGTRRLAVGDHRGALEMLEPAARALPGNELAWYSLGLAAVRLERWELAAEAFARAVELDPVNATSRLNLGTALANLVRCSEAVTVLERLIEDEPGAWQAHYWLARCYAELGEDERAREAMDRYRDQRPE